MTAAQAKDVVVGDQIRIITGEVVTVDGYEYVDDEQGRRTIYRCRACDGEFVRVLASGIEEIL